MSSRGIHGFPVWPGVFRHYWDFLPLSKPLFIVTLHEGNTPLLRCQKVRDEGSQAVICASMGIRVYVVLPQGKIAMGKLSQIMIHTITFFG